MTPKSRLDAPSGSGTAFGCQPALRCRLPIAKKIQPLISFLIEKKKKDVKKRNISYRGLQLPFGCTSRHKTGQSTQHL